MTRLILLVLFCLGCFGDDIDQRLAREIYKEMIESKSGFTTGSTTPIAESVAARLKAAGFAAADIFVGGANSRKANVVVRYRGTGGKKPLLLLAHIDVVEAKREDWTTDPFTLIEKDGYFYGRGTMDDKAQASVWIANLIRYKREGFRPARDLIVALTADEEGGGPFNGVDWLLKNKRELIDAEYALNEGGRGQMVDGKCVSNEISLSEKTFVNFRLEVRNKGGHSARPVPDNAIYHLAGALYRLGPFAFPYQLNDVTRAYFRQFAKVEKGTLGSDLAKVADGSEEAMRRVGAMSPPMNAMMRTTCVATMLTGGHAPNALPQMARANVNCRIFPGDEPEEVRKTLERVVADPKIKITFVPAVTADGIYTQSGNTGLYIIMNQRRSLLLSRPEKPLALKRPRASGRIRWHPAVGLPEPRLMWRIRSRFFHACSWKPAVRRFLK